MAKKIFGSRDEIDEFIESIRADLETNKFKTKNINSTFTLEKNNQTAELYFSQKAWIKMYALINTFSNEVQWHGLVRRREENVFFVDDILIFPHEVTSATVTSNQAEYEEWINGLLDEDFNALRFHGHSHVNMGVSPSGVDTGFRENILNNFGTPCENEDYFYVFFISNKKGEMNAQIFDLTNNVQFDSDEIVIDIMTDDDSYLSEFLSEANSVVKETPKYTGYTAGKNYASQSGYSSNSSGKKHKNKSQNDNTDSDYYRGSYFDKLYEDGGFR